MDIAIAGLAALIAARSVFFLIAVIGTISSTVFLVLVLLGSLRHLRLSRRSESQIAASTTFPPVTLLKPVHGTEPQLKQNLESFFQQDYPDFEIVFGARSLDNDAVRTVNELRKKYAHVKSSLIISGEPEWHNAKVYSLDKMIQSTPNSHFIITDSDIVVEHDFIRRIIPPLNDPKVGCVTAMYKGVPAPEFWSRMEALGMSVEMPSGVMVVDMLEGMKFALGAVMAVRRDSLKSIGGIQATREFYSDDFVLGNLISEAGYEVVLSDVKVGHVLTSRSFAKTFGDQLRWMQSTRHSRPKGHFGTGLTFAMPFGILGLMAAGAMGHWTLGWALFAWAWLSRTLQSAIVGGIVVGDKRALALCWLYPIRDLVGFFTWAGSYTSSTFEWRGELYRFTAGGRIVAERLNLTEEEEPAVVQKY
ncbi:ceramide glucosyltransferase, putative [Candidatus Koribacter versatilis Ellin345]|uniref:Ceramide glucosyltransferase, putative n=1 Tax=Koribacter versatilis (strain Ellin345) TaxID=204669 RepID=Q1ITS1_KORVE|nr:glycosyltransferase [Candidatus Koribacter versatilis]ABF39729.1 ceramide glucosyltransferase, putative [Candidatus Koribacter versatilis Ellin345]